jgi:hypothetical protein
VREGQMECHDRPGWGIELNEPFLRKKGTLVRWRSKAVGLAPPPGAGGTLPLPPCAAQGAQNSGRENPGPSGRTMHPSWSFRPSGRYPLSM